MYCDDTSLLYIPVLLTFALSHNVTDNVAVLLYVGFHRGGAVTHSGTNFKFFYPCTASVSRGTAVSSQQNGRVNLHFTCRAWQTKTRDAIAALTQLTSFINVQGF